MEELLLVNPRKRGRSSKGRTAAQKRATAKLVAFNRSKRRANPARRRKTYAAPVAKAARHYRKTTRRSNPIASYRRRRRNPTSTVGSMSMKNVLMGAVAGAAGATAVNFITTKLPLPATMPSAGRYAVKAALAVAIGVLGRKMLGRHAMQMAQGSLTVIMTDAIKETAAKSGVNLGYYSPAIQRNRQMALPVAKPAYRNSTYDGAGLGEYVS